MALRRRLLHDIADFQADPYPNIRLYVRDQDMTEACLLLTPSGKKALHLTIVFGEHYPFEAPQVSIESRTAHPNVFGSCICASILDTTKDYTPAYTLKGIAIQLLTFFSGGRLEQEAGGFLIDLDEYIKANSYFYERGIYRCDKCGFNETAIGYSGFLTVGQNASQDPIRIRRTYAAKSISNKESMPANIHQSRMAAEDHMNTKSVLARDHNGMDIDDSSQEAISRPPSLIERILSLPNELLMLVLERLDTRDMLAAASVCDKLRDFMSSYDAIRMRELQCFCLKESFLDAKLGVGVHIAQCGRQAMLESEFDLLSQEAFEKFGVRHSVQGHYFGHWLPLPISRRHWRQVKGDVPLSLVKLAKGASIPMDINCDFTVIYSFMSDIVVKLSREAGKNWNEVRKGTLTHASKKAVESYFGLFHLLLCLAIEHPQIVDEANRLSMFFKQRGHISRDAWPNLGQLMVAVLISDKGLTEDLVKAFIKERILRNVVWMLDRRGAGKAELSYIEPSAVSDYRLYHTFNASKTSYRLLMLLALFCRTARPPGRPIADICNDMFDKHGAAPQGTVEKVSMEIRGIRKVKAFPELFKAMGLSFPQSKTSFCAFLKATIERSVQAGYSRHALMPQEALELRRLREPKVEVQEDLRDSSVKPPLIEKISFFPHKVGVNKR